MNNDEQKPTTIPWGAFKAALDWRTEHYAHVQKLAASKEASPPYPPSGSDVFRPELWQAPHWKWLHESI